MKIKNKFPPNYEEIKNRFPFIVGRPVVFTYDGKLYNPMEGNISDDLMQHEETHVQQQEKIGVEEWWNKYLEDDQFRLEQELEAYQVQYKFALEYYPRNDRRKLLVKISEDLASRIYGSIITKEEAKELIRNGN